MGRIETPVDRRGTGATCALAYCDWAVAKGLLAIRSHVDTSDPSLLPVRAMLEVKKRVAPCIDLQLVAFPQDGVLRTPGGLDNLRRAMAFGHDCVMDPWYSLGSGDMLDVAQMTSQVAMHPCFEAVTTVPARILGLDDWGIAPGKQASFVLLQATSVVDALRLRAHRLAVYRKGVKLASSAPQVATLNLPGRPSCAGWALG